MIFKAAPLRYILEIQTFGLKRSDLNAWIDSFHIAHCKHGCGNDFFCFILTMNSEVRVSSNFKVIAYSFDAKKLQTNHNCNERLISTLFGTFPNTPKIQCSPQTQLSQLLLVFYFPPHNILCRGRKITICTAFFYEFCQISTFYFSIQYVDILVTIAQMVVRSPGRQEVVGLNPGWSLKFKCRKISG